MFMDGFWDHIIFIKLVIVYNINDYKFIFVYYL